MQQSIRGENWGSDQNSKIAFFVCVSLEHSVEVSKQFPNGFTIGCDIILESFRHILWFEKKWSGNFLELPKRWLLTVISCNMHSHEPIGFYWWFEWYNASKGTHAYSSLDIQEMK